MARPSDPALAVPAEPASGLVPSGFDPSRNAFVENLRQFNRRWGIKGEPSIEQVAHMLAIFGLEFIPSSRPIASPAPRSGRGAGQRTASHKLLPFIPIGRENAEAPRDIAPLAIGGGQLTGAGHVRTLLWRMWKRGEIHCENGLYYRDRDGSGEAGQTAQRAGPEGQQPGPKASPDPQQDPANARP